ncbi:hypothetical protein ACGVWS_05945 [Enterobacteriaceae bacterium LUAb1]
MLCNYAFQKNMTEKLISELGNDGTAEKLVPFINDAVVIRYPEVICAAQMDVIIGLAFGNRPNASGNENELAEPGPVNADLAHCCARFYRQKHVPMYLQWEIARFFQAGNFPDIPLSDVYSIEPYWDKQGNLIYLSTDGVVHEIVEKYFNNNPAAVGKAAVIGHRDHVKRCVVTCRDRKVNAFAPADLTLPVWYDQQSWQAWTRRRDLYVLQDMAVQMMTIAKANIANAF